MDKELPLKVIFSIQQVFYCLNPINAVTELERSAKIQHMFFSLPRVGMDRTIRTVKWLPKSSGGIDFNF